MSFVYEVLFYYFVCFWWSLMYYNIGMYDGMVGFKDIFKVDYYIGVIGS